MLTRSQKRAIEAYTRVKNRASRWHPEEQRPERKAYGSLAHRLPALIRTSGLASALAFIETRSSKEGHKAFAEDFKEALATLAKEVGISASNSQKMPVTSSIIAQLQSTAPAPDVTRLVLGLDLTSYQLLTLEALALAMWFKRFAQSVLGVSPTEEGR